MPDTSNLKSSFAECIPLFIALGDSTRLTIIQCLYEVGIEKKAEGTVGLNVNEITKRTSLSRPAVSHHLKILKDSGFINVEKKGVWVIIGKYIHFLEASCSSLFRCSSLSTADWLVR